MQCFALLLVLVGGVDDGPMESAWVGALSALERGLAQVSSCTEASLCTLMFGTFSKSASTGFARERVVVKLRAALARTQEPAARTAAPNGRLL